MPRLHAIPLRSTTLRLNSQNFRRELHKPDRSAIHLRGDTSLGRTASTLHTPVRVEMFRRRVLHFRGSGLEAGDLQEPPSRSQSDSASNRDAAGRASYSMFKAPEIKEFLLFRNGTPTDCQPIFLDAKKWQMVSRKEHLPVEGRLGRDQRSSSLRV